MDNNKRKDAWLVYCTWKAVITYDTAKCKDAEEGAEGRDADAEAEGVLDTF